MKRQATVLFSLAAAFVVGACDDSATEPMESEMQEFEVTVENVSAVYDFTSSGVFAVPAGQGSAGPLLPGQTYEFEFSAAPGQKLSFATMFVQSNDLFYAPDGMGIALYDEGGMQITGDVTADVYLWDAGTEMNEEPGLGLNQAPRQSGGNAGAADSDDTVRRADDAFGNLPEVSDVVRVTLDSTGPTSFRLRIENLSTGTTLMTSDGMMHGAPLAPGVWAVHSGADVLFTEGQPDRGEGLEGLAEDGAASGLGEMLAGKTGLTSPIAPGVFAVHSGSSVLFAAGMTDMGMGLEALAEDGDPTAIAGAVASHMNVASAGAFNTPVGASAPAPAFPGESYSFSFMAEPGDRLSFATMLVQSNDLFYAPAESGIDLFPNGAYTGDATGMVLLWDAGTEVNEEPGIGLHQAPRQSGANAGPAEGGAVRQVNDGYHYPDVSSVIRVTIRPVG